MAGPIAALQQQCDTQAEAIISSFITARKLESVVRAGKERERERERDFAVSIARHLLLCDAVCHRVCVSDRDSPTRSPVCSHRQHSPSRREYHARRSLSCACMHPMEAYIVAQAAFLAYRACPWLLACQSPLRTHQATILFPCHTRNNGPLSPDAAAGPTRANSTRC
jgi:hypothetical protein